MKFISAVQFKFAVVFSVIFLVAGIVSCTDQTPPAEEIEQAAEDYEPDEAVSPDDFESEAQYLMNRREQLTRDETITLELPEPVGEVTMRVTLIEGRLSTPPVSLEGQFEEPHTGYFRFNFTGERLTGTFQSNDPAAVFRIAYNESSGMHTLRPVTGRDTLEGSEPMQP